MTQQVMNVSYEPNQTNAAEFKEWLLGVLRMHNVNVTFTKRDGTERVMLCTLQEESVVPYEKTTDRVKQPMPDNISVWDLEKNAWRSFKIDTIKQVTFEI
jgi:hypothetical protein